MDEKGTYLFKSKNIFQNLLHEAHALQGMDAIEKLVESGGSLNHVPLQPLYLALRQLAPENIGELLPRLGVEQREALLDIDLWNKDDIDVHQFEYWLFAYAACGDDEVRLEFVKSSSFSLFLKARFNIWTFDVEDPQYPEHDNYFLTDDNLLLFEFDEDCVYVSEVRQFIRELYGDLGVENAYVFLFKLVSDALSSLQEMEYQHKKGRLLDFGMVDYYDALEFEIPYTSIEFMHNQLKKKKGHTGKIDALSATQGLNQSAIAPFAKIAQSIEEELAKVQSNERLAFLQFNFIKLINGEMTLSDSFKEGTMAMGQVGQMVRQKIELGHSYISHLRTKRPEVLDLGNSTGILEFFDFSDLHKIGLTLWRVVQKDLKKVLESFGFDNKNENFLGAYWNNFLDDALNLPAKLFQPYEKAIEINNAETYFTWEENATIFRNLIPFIKSFHDSFIELFEDGRLDDSFYMNYKVEEIDFEAIILSSLANHWLGVYHSESSGKMGLTVDEYGKFLLLCLDEEGQLKPLAEIEDKLLAFIKQFGLEKVDGLDTYLHTLLKMQVEGNVLAELSDADFRHVGGPIILNIL